MSSTTSSHGTAPKSMSSRLLTMKFMQRAAASAPAIPTPSAPEEPPSKRRKRDSDSPSTPRINIDELADQRAVQAAVAAEEAKRQAALERQGAEAGDTRWVLRFENPNSAMPAPKLAIRVVQAGYANLDVLPSANITSIDEDSKWEEKPIMVGRRSFGKFNKVLEKQQNPALDDSSDSESEEGEDEESEESGSDDDDPASDLIKASRQEAAVRVKAERKAKKKAEKAKSLELAKERKKKEVNLNGLTSLSGRQQSAPSPNLKCYGCGGPHTQAKCPKRGLPGGGPDRGFSKKARRQ